MTAQLGYRLRRGAAGQGAAGRGARRAAPVVGLLLLGGVLLAFIPALVLALPALALSAVFLARRPAAGAIAVIVLMASWGSLSAFTGLTGGAFTIRNAIELLLAALTVSAAWGYLVQGRRLAVWIWPGVAGLAAYLVVTLFQVPFAETTTAGLQAFRFAPAFALAFFLFAYADWPEGTRWRISQGLVVTAMLAGAYAVFRLIAGPAAAESEFAASQFNLIPNEVDGKIALFGSFPGRMQLGGWTAVAIPFCLAVCLGTRGRWRLAAALAIGLCAVALMGSQTRIALVAVVAGALVTLILYVSSRGFGVSRVGTAATALVVVFGAGLLAFSLTVGQSDRSSERFGNILTPNDDPAFEARLFKWDAALEEIGKHPFGQGLGAAGSAQHEFSRVVRISSYDIDNSYLEIAYEQGFPMLFLFAGSVLWILVTLARSSVRTLDPRRSMLGIGACGAFAAWLVLLLVGAYREQWSALLAFIALGIGAGGFVSASKPAEDE